MGFSAYERSSERNTICYCPKCEKTHKRFINWAGRGTPRIYCVTCEKIIKYNGTRRGITYVTE